MATDKDKCMDPWRFFTAMTKDTNVDHEYIPHANGWRGSV